MGPLALAIAIVGSVVVGCTTEPTGPRGPAGLWTSLTADGFDVAWQPVAGVVQYELRFLDLDAQPAEDPVSVLTPDTSVPVTGLVEGHRYQFDVRAVPPEGNGVWSPAVVAAFVVPVLPTIRVDTVDREPVVTRSYYLQGSLELDPGGGGAVVNSAVEIKGRGNSTWAAPKKPYRLKLAQSQSLLGMPASRHWVLLADYYDPTHLRNQTALGLGGDTDLPWTPRARQVEVVLNGAYLGVYLLTEHIRVGADRVNIDAMGDTDISGDALTGGYLAEIDNYLPGPDDIAFYTNRGTLVTLKDPEPPAPEQLDYFTDYVNQFESVLHSAGFADPTTGYAAFLDVGSMLDYYIVQEVTRNLDAFIGSTYFHKPRLGKIVMSPLWDFDLSMGNPRSTRDTGSPTGWWARRSGLPWIDRLFDDPGFEAAVAARWAELKPVIDQLPAQVLANGTAIAAAMDNDRVLWPPEPAPVDTPQELSDWLQTRIDWIDANI